MKKLRSRKGETIVETLVAILIVVLSFAMLTGAIVSAAKINKQNEDMDVAFDVSKANKENKKIRVTHYTSEVNIATTETTIEFYTTDDDNAYRYYLLEGN